MPDLYDQITTTIIEQLIAGVVPWKSPYFSTTGFPRNFATQKEYQGINVLLLGSQHFTSPYFLTFLQAKELGGSVKKGERGFLVVKYGTYNKEEDQTQEGEDTRKRGYLRGYKVFNSSQIENIDFPEPPTASALTTTEKTDRARAIIDSMPRRPPIHQGSAVPCYRLESDSVHMPKLGYFTSEEVYYSTLFHELGHATGHQTRLARKSLMDNKGFGAFSDTSRKIYAEEELVAEMTASFLSTHAGIIEDDHVNSAAYLQSWIKALQGKDARTWIVRAASQGQKAADFILGRSLNLEPEPNIRDPRPTESVSFVAKLNSRDLSSQPGRSR